MPNVKHEYAGSPNRRIITAADFRSVGVEDQVRSEWLPENDHIVQVSQAAADYLLQHETGFSITDETPRGAISDTPEEGEGTSESGDDANTSTRTSRASRSARAGG